MKLELRNIKKEFDDIQVLKGISFLMEGGHAFGLLGTNGAGKTTTIRILLNEIRADEGEILLDGKPLNCQSVSIGCLPEKREEHHNKKLIDYLLCHAEENGMKRKAALESINYWLERLDMMEYQKKQLGELSKGNRQKIWMLTAFIHDPAIVILDEPFAELDLLNTILLKNIVREQITNGKIVFLSSHRTQYIEEFCDQIAILKDGEIVLKGDLDAIKKIFPHDRLIVKSKEPMQVIKEYEKNCTLMVDDKLMIKLGSPYEKRAVMARIIENYDVDEIKLYEPSLKDIFESYTGKETKWHAENIKRRENGRIREY